VELVVAMTVGGIVLALVASVSVRQQRIYADVAARGALSGQLRQAATLLPIELRGVASGAGDIREARDTAIEFRATLATAVVCDTQPASLVLAPPDGHHTTFASYLAPVSVGDTAWLFTPDDSAGRWRPFSVTQIATLSPGSCDRLGPSLLAEALVSSRTTQRLSEQSATAGAIGSVIRVTRPVRYSLYRGGDGRWYLGQRDWNVGIARFNTIQPVSGPYSSPSSRGLVFEYFDSTGAPLATPVGNPRLIASIRVSVRGQSSSVMRAFARGAQGRSSDSVNLTIAFRNRR